MKLGKRLYLDANVFMYAIEGHEQYAALLGRMFEEIAAHNIPVLTSDLTLAECLVMPVKTGNTALANLYQQHLRTHAGLECVAVSRDILLEAARLRAISNMKLPDAIHVATAATMQCDMLVSNDKGIRTPDNMQLLLLSDGL